MERSSQPDSYELSDYVAVIRRRWKVVVLGGIIGLAAAVGYTFLAPATYSATATIFVTGATSGATQIVNGRTTSAIDLDTEAQIVQSASVGTLARKSLHSRLSATKLVKAITVTVPPNSQVLQVNCAEGTAADAAKCANAFADAYLQNRSDATVSGIKKQLAGLQQQVNDLQQKITNVTARMRPMPHGSRKRISAGTELTMYNSQLDSLSNHMANLMAQSTNTSGGRIITNAVAPRAPTSPQRKLAWPSGLVAGIVAGLIVAYWRDRSDKRVRTAHDVETLFDLPVLLDLADGKRRLQAALAGSASRTGQAFAELAHSLTATLGQGNHVVLVAGTSAGSGGSVAAANIAAAVARTGSNVALVCADIGGSVAPQIFGLGRSPGLAEVILDSATVGETEKRLTTVPGLRVIPPGGDQAASSRLQRDAAQRLVKRLHIAARYVFFEAPPTTSGADLDALAQLVDAAVVVVEVPRTLREDVKEGVRHLDRMGVAVLGAVVLPPLGKPARVISTPAASAAKPAKASAKDGLPAHGTSGSALEGDKDDFLVYSPRSQPGPDAGDTTATVTTRSPEPVPGSDGTAADGAPGRIARG
jgi:capsular polysaccharide biosynthesis protein/MinD-like ATPase involved in chromosome partitioning or flagellar assembly